MATTSQEKAAAIMIRQCRCATSSKGTKWTEYVEKAPPGYAGWGEPYWTSSRGRVDGAEQVFVHLLDSGISVFHYGGERQLQTASWGDALDALAANPRRAPDGIEREVRALRGEDHRYADLEGADLRGIKGDVNFEGADLQKANLSEPFGRGGSRPILRRANLEGALLEKTGLSYADLTGARLKGASLWGANVCWADLRKADLRESLCFAANLEKADLREADLRGANLAYCRLDGASFDGADLHGADLSGSYILGNSLDKAADLSETNFTRARIWCMYGRLDLSNKDLRGVYFNSAALTNVTFREADLTGAQFVGASIRDAVFEGAVLKGAVLKGAILSDGNLAATFEGADLSGADLRGAVFNGPHLHEGVKPVFRRANLKGALLAKSNAVDSDFRDADFEGADLSGVRFTGSDLRGARFRGAKLSGTDFRGADLTGANFEGADLSKARMP